MSAVEDRDVPVLMVRDLTIERSAAVENRHVVRGASFTVNPGSVTALVGESGSGKTMLARSILRLPPPGMRVARGQIELAGRELLSLNEQEMREVRGAQIGMIFQEPLTALNPALSVGVQLGEAARVHLNLTPREVHERCVDMLARVQLPDPAACMSRFPHEFSGGMRQRIMIASVMMLRPALLIADEPTTALDPITQQGVLELMLRLAEESRTAVLLISHDLALVARYATEQIIVMRRGEIVEQGRTAEILRAPRHEYTRELLASAEGACQPSDKPTANKQLLRACGVRVAFAGRRRWWFGRGEQKEAVRGVDITIHHGETLALVGESGSGKSTFGKALLGLVPRSGGTIQFDTLTLDRADHRRQICKRAQIIFQDPYSSLDPRMRIRELIGEAIRADASLTGPQRLQRVLQMLEDVGLPVDFADRYAHQLSGGQRQRVGIARALVGKPDFVVADEALSALDVTVRAQVVQLLRKLQQRQSFAMLFISHDLAVVEKIADSVAIMRQGQLVEVGSVRDVFANPTHPYTRALLDASPALMVRAMAVTRLYAPARWRH